MADREDEKADRFGSEVSGGYAVSFSTGRTGAMSGGLNLEEMAGRIETNRKLGWYVYEQDGEVFGYAYAAKHRERAAYQWCCEVSVYIDERCRRKGVAALLYERLLRELKAKGYVNAYAVITLPNEKSVGFHEKLGFMPIGVYEKIGFKFGRWHDVGWWALRINEPGDSPVAPIT